MEINQEISEIPSSLTICFLLLLQAHVPCHSNPLLQVCTNRGISFYSVQSYLTFSHHMLVLPFNYVTARRKHLAGNLIIHLVFSNNNQLPEHITVFKVLCNISKPI